MSQAQAPLMTMKVGKQAVQTPEGEVQAVQVKGHTEQVVGFVRYVPTEHAVQAEAYTPPLQAVQLGPYMVAQEEQLMVLGS